MQDFRSLINLCEDANRVDERLGNAISWSERSKDRWVAQLDQQGSNYGLFVSHGGRNTWTAHFSVGGNHEHADSRVNTQTVGTYVSALKEFLHQMQPDSLQLVYTGKHDLTKMVNAVAHHLSQAIGHTDYQSTSAGNGIGFIRGGRKLGWR